MEETRSGPGWENNVIDLVTLTIHVPQLSGALDTINSWVGLG